MDAQLSLQTSQADAALKHQQDSTTALTAGLKAELAHQRAEAQARKQQQDCHIAALEAQCAALVAQLDLSHQQAMQAQASLQFEASAQASAAQQSYHLLHEAFLEQSAVAEEYDRQSQAEFAALHSQIHQLESEQAGWASCVEALGSRLVSSSASRCSLLGAAMTTAEDDSLAPASIRHVLQGAVDAEGPSSFRLQQSAPATPETPLLMSQPRTPGHSQDLHDAPRQSFSSFEALTLVIRGYDEDEDRDSTTSPYSSAPASPFSDGQEWCTPIALLLGRQASNGDSAPPSPRRAAAPVSDRYGREWMDPAESAVEQPMPSTSRRSIRPLGRGQLVYQAPAASGRSKRRGAAKRVSVGSRCSSVVMNVKQQRCKPGQWRCSFKK